MKLLRSVMGMSFQLISPSVVKPNLNGEWWPVDWTLWGGIGIGYLVGGEGGQRDQMIATIEWATFQNVCQVQPKARAKTRTTRSTVRGMLHTDMLGHAWGTILLS